MEIDMTEINAVLRDAVHRSAQQVSVCADEEQGSVVFTGITPLVEAQGCIGFSETLVVIVVFPERLVEKRKDDIDSFTRVNESISSFLFSTSLSGKTTITTSVSEKPMQPWASTSGVIPVNTTLPCSSSAQTETCCAER